MNKSLLKSSSQKNCSFMSTMASTNSRNFTASQQQIMKLREKYRPLTASKKNPCPSVLVKPTRPQNIKINQYIVEEQNFGLKPLTDGELENIFSTKGKKKQKQKPQIKRIPQSQLYKVMRNLNYLQSYTNKTRVIDLIQQKKLNELFKKAKK